MKISPRQNSEAPNANGKFTEQMRSCETCQAKEEIVQQFAAELK